MDSDREYRGGQEALPGAGGPTPPRGRVPLPGFGGSPPGDGRVPLPEWGEPDWADRPVRARRDGIRRVRRMSNWTLAALIAGTGAATVALAHNAFPTASTTAGTASTTAGAGGTAATNGTAGPQVTHSVATTSGSGVTVTTTTHTANGKVIVTHVRHAKLYHDN
jgi:hypothetical protein